MRGSTSITAAAVGAVLVLGAAGPARAGDALRPTVPSQGSGSEVTAPGKSTPDSQQAREKVASTEAVIRAMARGDRAAAAAANRAYTARWGGPGLHAAGSRAASPELAATAAAAPASRVLALTQYGQLKNYYCGPASGYMIIRYLHGGAFTSRYDKSSLSQAHLANLNHMKTDYRGLTSWGYKDFSRGVNRWRGTNWYVEVNAPSATLVKGVFTQSIGMNGMPFAADTVEYRGLAHYNKHPTDQTIGHWIVAYGYSSSGATGSWADPATSVWTGVMPKFSASTTGFAKYLQTNGITY
ncbi:hypothetical protein GCM10027053_40040 [Intrasporangium mesophilum]